MDNQVNTVEQLRPANVKTMSDLILLALQDLALCANNRDFTINMEVYYANGALSSEGNLNEGYCSVCFAGAVMAQSLAPITAAVQINGRAWPKNFGNNLGVFRAAKALAALNDLREGYVATAAMLLGLEQKQVVKCYPLNRAITSYHANSAMFVAEMQQLAADLKAVGL